MKSTLSLLLLLLVWRVASAQESTNEKLLSELSQHSCNCIDSITATDKSRAQVSQEVRDCIQKQVGAWQLGSKIAALEKQATKGKKTKETISLGLDPKSKEYQESYFELERYLVSNCKALMDIIKMDDAGGTNTMSKNPESVKWYSAGVDNLSSEEYEKAITNLKAALAIDSLFSYAWDNLGIAYRKLERYPEALAAYQKSIEVNPEGKTPWQNTAVVYEYQKEYPKAIEAYQRLQQIDKKDPEAYYGIGRMYAYKTHELEKGLKNLCVAYRLYLDQGSPYRTDAEKVINFLYGEMKKEGNEKRFNEILKEFQIDSN